MQLYVRFFLKKTRVNRGLVRICAVCGQFHFNSQSDFKILHEILQNVRVFFLSKTTTKTQAF